MIFGIVEPENLFVVTVQYHKAVGGCYYPIVKLLQLLVRYFEEQVLDTVNTVTVQDQCRSLNTRFSEP